MFYLFFYFNINNIKKVINFNYIQIYRNFFQIIFILIFKWKNSCIFMKFLILNIYFYYYLYKSVEKSSLDVLVFFYFFDEKNLVFLGFLICIMYK